MYILLDIGGTNTRIAFSKTGEKIDEIVRLKTLSNFDDALREVEMLIKERLEGSILGVGVGIAGPLDKEHTKTVNAPNLPLWNDKPLKLRLEEITQAPVVLDNDCVLAGIGEAQYGAGKGDSIVVYMTISTGVGGARIVNGMPDVSAHGFEPGHQILVVNGENISLEKLVSGTALEKRYGKKAEDIEDERVWQEVVRYLSVGLNNTLVYWSPDKIVLGGSVMNKISLDLLEQKFKETVFIFPEVPPIEKAVLDEPVLWGALALASQKK